jgi:hypothetical protein
MADRTIPPRLGFGVQWSKSSRRVQRSLSFALGIVLLVLVFGCKKERARPVATRPSADDEAPSARLQREQREEVSRDYYGGCLPDGGSGDAGTLEGAATPIVLEEWLTAHHLEAVDDDACWAKVLHGPARRPRSLKQPAAAFIENWCRCDRELTLAAASAPFLICTTGTDGRMDTVVYTPRSGILRQVLMARTQMKAPPVEWVPASRRTALPGRYWPGPTVSLEPVGRGDSIAFVEHPCPICSKVTSIVEERQVDPGSSEADPGAWGGLDRFYSEVCGAVGVWSWSSGKFVRVSAPFPGPPASSIPRE